MPPVVCLFGQHLLRFLSRLPLFKAHMSLRPNRLLQTEWIRHYKTSLLLWRSTALQLKQSDL